MMIMGRIGKISFFIPGKGSSIFHPPPKIYGAMKLKTYMMEVELSYQAKMVFEASSDEEAIAKARETRNEAWATGQVALLDFGLEEVGKKKVLD